MDFVFVNPKLLILMETVFLFLTHATLKPKCGMDKNVYANLDTIKLLQIIVFLKMFVQIL